MGHPGVSPETALQLNQTVLYWVACTLAGAALIALLAYLLFLFLEIFSSRPSSKARLATVCQPLRPAVAPVGACPDAIGDRRPFVLNDFGGQRPPCSGAL